jgi:dephospho-CoA kinase
VGHWKDKYVIGLTGNIATGKSLVLKMLQHLGAFTIDADGLAHQVMLPNAPAYQPVIEWFGKWIVDADGRINRERLGAVAFSHPEALKRLEAITHPIIGKGIDTLITRSQHKVVVVEAIKLLEGPLAQQVDAIWVVDSTPENQLIRLIKTRGMSELEARKRIVAQNPQADKLAVAHVVIQNNGDPNETFGQVRTAWAKMGQRDAREAEVSKTVQVAPAQQVAGPAKKRELKELHIKRPRQEDLDALATVINQALGKKLTKKDILLNFGETSYLIAESDHQIVGTIAFLVENLITQCAEIVIPPDVPKEPVLSALIQQMEASANSLQSEVSFIYLYPKDSTEIIELLQKNLEYVILPKVEDIKFPAWREALRSRPEGSTILYKKLRESTILTPF